MAKIDIIGMETLDEIFAKLEAVDEAAEEAVKICVPVLEKSMISAIESAANRGYSKNVTAPSVAGTEVKKNDRGFYSVVKPMGTNGKGVSNAYVARLLEYGRGNGKGRRAMTMNSGRQAPSPWRARAVNGAKATCEAMMDKKIGEWTKSIGG